MTSGHWLFKLTFRGHEKILLALKTSNCFVRQLLIGSNKRKLRFKVCTVSIVILNSDAGIFGPVASEIFPLTGLHTFLIAPVRWMWLKFRVIPYCQSFLFLQADISTSLKFKVDGLSVNKPPICYSDVSFPLISQCKDMQLNTGNVSYNKGA